MSIWERINGWQLRIMASTMLLMASSGAQAAIDNSDVSEQIMRAFRDNAGTWASVITDRASWLFWCLVAISMIFTFGFMALRQADIGEFFAEFIRFTVYVGFYYWLLLNGPDMAGDIILSLQQVGGTASGLGPEFRPGNVMDIGFEIFFRIIDDSSIWSMGETLCALILGLVIIAMMCLIAANMIILLCSSWILLYAGVFFLGFGGSRWTSDIAINYFKTVLGLAASIMTMVLIIGIGNSILDDYYTSLSEGIHLKELAVVAIAAIILFLLVDKVPQMVAGIINGSSISGPGGFGAGTAMGAMALGGAAVATGGVAAVAGAKQAFGGASALNAAFKQANTNMSSGQGAFKNAPVGAGSGGSKTPSFAAAMNTGANYMSDVAANLGKGTAKAAKEGISSRMESVRESLSNTAGGKIASAIRDQGASQNTSEAPTDSGSSGAGSEAPDSKHDEVNDFVNKEK